MDGVCQPMVLKRQFAERIVLCRGRGLGLVELPLN